MTKEQPKVAGEGAGEFVNAVMGWIFSFARLIMFLVFPVLAIGADLYLSGAFMDNYSTQYGARGLVSTLLPWIFTLGTTGLQGAINARTKAGFRNSSPLAKVVIVVGWGLIALDTATDVGGWTALYTGDVNLGADIFPPGWSTDPYWMIVSLVVAIVCGGQEKILPLLYGRWDFLRGDDDAPGAWLVRAGEAGGGYLYSAISNVLKPVGLLAIVALDVVLTPNFLGSATGTPVAWIISATTTIFNYLLWLQTEKVVLRRMPNGKLGLSHLNAGAKGALAVAWALNIAELLLDGAGYTALVFGVRPGSFLLPPVITLNWVITITIVMVACFAGELLISELLRRPTGAPERSSNDNNDNDNNDNDEDLNF